jgi:hypothetical protein
MRGQCELLSQPPSDGARRRHETYGGAANRMRVTLWPKDYFLERKNVYSSRFCYKDSVLSERIEEAASRRQTGRGRRMSLNFVQPARHPLPCPGRELRGTDPCRSRRAPCTRGARAWPAGCMIA